MVKLKVSKGDKFLLTAGWNFRRISVKASFINFSTKFPLNYGLFLARLQFYVHVWDRGKGRIRVFIREGEDESGEKTIFSNANTHSFPTHFQKPLHAISNQNNTEEDGVMAWV